MPNVQAAVRLSKVWLEDLEAPTGVSCQRRPFTPRKTRLIRPGFLWVLQCSDVFRRRGSGSGDLNHLDSADRSAPEPPEPPVLRQRPPAPTQPRRPAHQRPGARRPAPRGVAHPGPAHLLLRLRRYGPPGLTVGIDRASEKTLANPQPRHPAPASW
jgi:hypothetical protein